MASAEPRTSCRSLFKQQKTNSSIHNINTRNKHNLCRSNANLFCFQRSTFYAGIKIFNSLPPTVTILSRNMKTFKAALRKYLHTHSFTL